MPRPAPAPKGAPQTPRVIGRVEARLQTFGKVRGWCFGSWGEASEDVHALVQRIASSRLLVTGMQPGGNQYCPSVKKFSKCSKPTKNVHKCPEVSSVQKCPKCLKCPVSKTGQTGLIVGYPSLRLPTFHHPNFRRNCLKQPNFRQSLNNRS